MGIQSSFHFDFVLIKGCMIGGGALALLGHFFGENSLPRSVVILFASSLSVAAVVLVRTAPFATCIA